MLNLVISRRLKVWLIKGSERGVAFASVIQRVIGYFTSLETNVSVSVRCIL